MKTFLLFIISFFVMSSFLCAQTDANRSIKGICIYIDYPDTPASIDEVTLDSIINGVSYNEPGIDRTFREYWLQETRRHIDITHEIFFWTAPETAEFYKTVTWQEGIDVWRIALEAIISENPNYDWANLTTHPNGSLMEVMIISSSDKPAGVGGAHWPNWTLSNGVFVRPIHGSALHRESQDTRTIFVICHEAGHSVFDFPDTYDYGGDSGGTGFFTLMSGTGPDVEPVGGPFLEIRNWGHSVEIEEAGEHTITLKADGDSIFVYRNPHLASEWFTIEARKRSNPGNSRFPAELGLVIWHTDDEVTTSNTEQAMTANNHYRHSIEQADGLFELENSNALIDLGDVYLPSKSFTDVTVPSSTWWDGESSGFEVKDIKFVGEDHIQFTVTIPKLHEEHYDRISTDNWLALEAAAHQVGYEPEKAFDNDVSTYYHVPWNSSESRPHEIVIYLGDEYLISEAFYQANDNFSPPWEGRVENMGISVSTDGIYYEDIGGEFLERTRYNQFIELEPTLGSYVKFSAFSSFDDDPRTSMAEIALRRYSV